jgi:hypothetical protein
MRSFSLIKTNVGLTTNIKIMVDSNYNLYLDSIDSNSDLSNDNFKKVQFNSNNYYDELIPYFYNGLDPEISYSVKDDNDSSLMYDTFDKQIDDLYHMGCNNIVDNKYYKEDFEYFAPLYVSKSGLPKYFSIFRVDGPGIISLNKDNFKTEILNKLKSVKVVDLTRNTPIGDWLYNNITNNKAFPLNGFEIDFRRSELSYWNGIDYINGCYTQAAYFFENILEYEKTYNDLEKFIYDGYKTNKIVYPHIYNLSFLFDDTPGTPTSLRPWSLNRYCGFYFDDFIQSKSVSTYLPSVLKPDAVIITGNIITNSNNTPFNDFTLSLPQIYVEYMGNFYPVNKINKTVNGVNTIQWQIISDVDLTGQQALINKNIITIDNNNKITYIDGSSFTINDWNTADLWLIKIDNKYHTIQYDSGDYYIYTDYGFTITSNQLTYYINSPDPNYSTTIDVYSQGSTPVSFPIYKCQFTDIKNIDSDIIETEFSKFEYDKSNEVIQTDESKMHLINLTSNNNPKSETDYIIGGEIANIPVSSHYTANSETFRLLKDPITGSASLLNNLWKKNQPFVKWGFKNSISANDYPYLLNNSFSAEDFNRTTDPYSSTPHRYNRNLDYFYTINSSTSSYASNTLHVENIVNNNIDTTFFFDLNQYINNTYDYFTYFFERKAYLDNSSILKNIKKYSYFNSGNSSLPNITSFRGLKFLLYDVTSVKINNGVIQNININSNNTYEDYKFNILLSKNNVTINTDSSNFNKLSITTSNNTLQWNIIDFWKLDKTYATSSLVNYYDILYTSVTVSNISNPNLNPATSSDWTYFTQSTLFWNPSTIYVTYSSSLSSIVYNSGEYYYFNGLTTSSFYNPSRTYNAGNIVKFNNKNWISTTASNVPPDGNSIWRDTSNNINFYWNETTETDSFGNPLTTWTLIELWDSQTIYSPNNLATYNDVLYQATNITTMGMSPDTTTDWNRFYSFAPDTNYIYGKTISSNNIIYINNSYYLCTGNTGSSTLDNGINIYVNNKYKNVLINIYVNDNTLPNLSNIERDVLYKDLYSNITAFNFSNAINDVINNYGFVNKVKYINLGASYSYIYDFDNINSYKNLTSFLTVDGPDQFLSRIMSLNKQASTLQPSQFNVKASLNNGNISTVDQINYYNNLPLASVIDDITTSAELLPNYSGINNKIYNILYRLSGQYDPIFLEIELFKKGLTYSGNFIFDTSLTNFGLTKNVLVSKINRTGNVLKLKNSPNINSIYPMIDEFGYKSTDIFIFKSNWDVNYFLECIPIITPDDITTSSITNRLAIFNPISVTPNRLA